MAGNYLEQIASEWYDYLGYVVRTNTLVDKRTNGGYNGELDVLAYNLLERKLIHLEASMDADSWAQREKKYLRKFKLGDRFIPEIFAGFPWPPETWQKIILLGYGSTKNRKELAGAKLIVISDFMAQIVDVLRKRPIYRNAISESKPILRTLQFVLENKNLLND